jgi:hypothetical protein
MVAARRNTVMMGAPSLFMPHLIHPLSGPGQRDEEVAHVLLFRRTEVSCR